MHKFSPFYHFNNSKVSLISALFVIVAMVSLTGCNKKEDSSLPNGGNAQQTPPVAATQPSPPQSGTMSQTTTTTSSQTTTTTSPAAASTQPGFTDLADVETKEIIDSLQQLGVFDGLNLGTTFKPYQPISRAEYITWLFKAYNAIRSSGDKIRLAPQVPPYFTDLPTTHPAYKYVQALANAGYSVGYDDHTFKPEQIITREELIAIKVGVDQGKAIDPDPTGNSTHWNFGDFNKIDKRYTGYIQSDYFKYNNGGTPKYSHSNIVRTFGKTGIFKPKDPVYRNEAAASLWQVDEFGNATADTALERLKEQAKS